MADIFVWSGAGGGADGTAWEDAFVTLAAALDGTMVGFTEGTDFVYVRSVHSEDENAAQTLDAHNSDASAGDDKVRVLSVTGDTTGTSPGALTAGATLNTQNANELRILGNLYFFGINFRPHGQFRCGVNSSYHSDIVMEECELKTDNANPGYGVMINDSSNNKSYNLRLIDCVFAATNLGHFLRLQGGRFLMEGGSFANNYTSLTTLQSPGDMRLVGVDMSSLTGNIFNESNGHYPGIVSLEGCLLNAGVTKVATAMTAGRGQIGFFHCQDGVDADPAYAMEIYRREGSIKVDAARYRTDGASDGERTNPYSWDMDNSGGLNTIELYEPLISPPMTAWTDGNNSDPVTFTFYVASGATLQDDEFWIELFGPNDASKSSLAVRKTSRLEPLGTPANLTADGVSTWNGADVGTKQKVTITYTPDKPGVVVARAFLAKPSERVSVDPKIYVDM